MAESSDAVLEVPIEDIALGGTELEYAGFWSRVAALIVDNAIVTIFGLALLIAAGSVGAEAVAIANIAYIIIALLYWPLMESSERQATIGKQLLGIQVTDANGARLTFVRSLLRNLAKIISSLPFGLGFLLAAFTARKQALHDMLTKCLVVRAGPSHFLKAVLATVAALVISIGGGYYYFSEVYLPQMAEEMGRQMEKGTKQAQKGAPVARPAPIQPPVAKAPAPTPAPAAQPAPATTTPGEPKLMTPQEIAEFEKKMEQAKREPAKVAAVTPPAPVAAPAKPAAGEIKPAPAKPAPAPLAKETTPTAAAPPAKPAPAPAAKETAPTPAAPPAKPESAPAAKEAGPKLAAAPAEKAKPEAKPATVPAAKPKPAPAPAKEVSTPLVSEPPLPARPAEPRAPAVPAAVAAAPSGRPARSPKFNDVMTAVMYRDPAAVAELLELGWWVDRPDSNGVTPLMTAAWIGDVAMARLLLKGGADPNRRGPGGSVLDYAGRSGDPHVIEMLRSSGAR